MTKTRERLGLPEALRPLTADEASKIQPLTDDEIEQALEEGRLDREAVEAAVRYRVALPPRMPFV